MLESLGAFGFGALGYIIPFLFVLTIVVFFHELGHFAVARWFGVRVEVFSIGFGPELFGRNDKHGTRWRFAAIPLGGYVKFYGDEDAASAPDQEALQQMTPEQRRESYHTQPVLPRMAIVAAGPFANFLLAIVIFAALFAIVGKNVTEAHVDVVQPGSAAESAGIQPGDIIREIEGVTIESFTDLQRVVSINADRPLNIVIERGGVLESLSVTPRMQEVEDAFGNNHRVGVIGIARNVDSESYSTVIYPLHKAVVEGVAETWFVVERTGIFIARLVTGRESAEQLGGPIRIAQVSGDVASIGLPALINLTAILSVSIGLLNLLPIPMLDGGHLVFYAIEAVRGRPLKPEVLDMSFRVGLVFVLGLMLFATWNDLTNLNLL
jgi:regulator of sigma E protease